MKNITRNTAAVLVLTLFTGLVVFTTVQLGDRLFGTQEASAQTAITQAATGESAAAGDQSSGEYDGDGPSGYGGSGNGYGRSSGTTDPYGYGDSSGSGSTDGTTMTCPATGCSASTCHAMQ